jgi:hypothetical protein
VAIIRAVLVCLLGLAGLGCEAIHKDPVLSSWDKPAPKAKDSPFASYVDK